MSMLQTTSEHSPSDKVHCPRCDAALPPHAIFCGSCGERIGKEKMGPSPAQGDADAASRYRITSLVRRRPYVNLFFAFDNQQHRTVVIRNIDISSLDEEAQAKASELAQSEYDLLRQQNITHLMPVIDLQNNQSHLLTITGQPLRDNSTADAVDTHAHLHTLQDFVQHGKGLPSQSLVIAWIRLLCQSVESLHQQQIVIGDLDPYAILLNGDDHQSQPLLAVSWLPTQLRGLLAHIVSGQVEASSTSVLATSFNAPEVLLGKVEPASDVYSLGAILYLLLTGTPPAELMQRTQQRLRPPYELNPRISRNIDEIVMHALSLEPSERFQSVKELAEALSSRAVAQVPKAYAIPPRPTHNGKHTQTKDQIADIETISFMPLPKTDLVFWETPAGGMRSPSTPTPTPASPEHSALIAGTQPHQPATEEGIPSGQDASEPLSSHSDDASGKEANGNADLSLVQQFTQQISGILPAIPHLPKQITGRVSPAARLSQPLAGQQQTSPQPSLTLTSIEGTKPVDTDTSLLKHIQRIIIGQRQHTTMAAATIENPLRVQPDQGYSIRIRLMGRDEPDTGIPSEEQPSVPRSRLNGTKAGIQPRGLSAYAHGKLVYVEVRSAIHQHYAYLVQQAAVAIPAHGYVAEVVIPMQPFGRKSDGRRERLHIFFFDEMHHPIYEKPFVLELLVSHLVQAGREGHHVLPIPQ